MTDKLPLSRLAERVGSELGASSWITVAQARIDEFAHCTGDDQWIHVDPERAARESPFGGTVAHGFLTLALLAPACLEVLVANVSVAQAVNYGVEKVRFVAPVRAGKNVRDRIKLTAFEARGGGRFLATLENTVEIAGEERPALVATVLVMLMGVSS